MKFIIDEKRLRGLLESEIRLNAFECSGFDNWEWYGDSLNDYVNERFDTDEYIDANDGINQLVDEEIKNYKIFREIDPNDYYGKKYTEMVCK